MKHENKPTKIDQYINMQFICANYFQIDNYDY